MLSKASLLAPLASGLLLAGIALEWGLLHAPAEGADAYHARVRRAVEGIPLRIGPWQGVDLEMPEEALEMLQPNAVLSRSYRRPGSGRSIKLLLVHCRDARDLSNHYPPVCYPGSGWELQSARPRDWRAGGATIPGTEYHFRSPRLGGAPSIVVANFLIRPTGEIDRGMAGVRSAAVDPRRKVFGAGQVQLVFPGDQPEDSRDEAFAELVGACLPAVRAIQAGGVE